MLNSFSPNLTRQVRSIMTDKYGGLWFGTKGDGLLHVKNYRDGVHASNTEVYSLDKKQNAMSYVKQNREFQVYSMLESRYRNGFWEPALRACAIILLIMESCMNFQIGKQELEEKWQKCIPSLRKVTVSFIWRLRVKVFIK